MESAGTEVHDDEKGCKTRDGSGRDGSPFIRLASEAFVVMIPVSTLIMSQVYRTNRTTRICFEVIYGPRIGAGICRMGRGNCRALSIKAPEMWT